eukprot:Clim_evm9s158 gene=Clim_evmTU9s158
MVAHDVTQERRFPGNAQELRRDLNEALVRKKTLDASVVHFERQIYALETAYLEETNMYGNVVRGWTDYLHKGHPMDIHRKIRASERIFSNSSATTVASLDPQPWEMPADTKPAVSADGKSKDTPKKKKAKVKGNKLVLKPAKGSDKKKNKANEKTKKKKKA